MHTRLKLNGWFYATCALGVVVILLLISILARPTAAAVGPKAFVPLVTRQAPPPLKLRTTLTVLVPHDSGLASIVVMRDTRAGAASNAIRTFIATATRPDYRLRVAEEIGGQLHDVAGVPAVQVAEDAPQAPVSGSPGPAWTPPGPKQGAVDMEGVQGGLRVVFTSRQPDEPTGEFYLMTIDLPISGVAPFGG
jgi:hypothetical protein